MFVPPLRRGERGSGGEVRGRTVITLPRGVARPAPPPRPPARRSPRTEGPRRGVSYCDRRRVSCGIPHSEPETFIQGVGPQVHYSVALLVDVDLHGVVARVAIEPGAIALVGG